MGDDSVFIILITVVIHVGVSNKDYDSSWVNVDSPGAVTTNTNYTNVDAKHHGASLSER